MRIAVNALAVRSRGHGVGRYVINLVSALAAHDDTNEYVVFVGPAVRDLFEAGPSLRVETIDLRPAVRVVWEHARLPVVLRRLGIDLLFGPAHTVPLWKTTRQVVSILDMSWFTAGRHHTTAKRLYFRAAIPASVRSADAIVTISEATRRDVLEMLDVGDKKVIATPLGLDKAFRRSSAEEAAQARRRHGLEDAPYVISVGVFEPRKNQAGLIRAFSSLVAAGAASRHRLVLAGSVGLGWRNSAIGHLVDELGMSERVRILDSLPDEELRHLLTGADVFAYPSFYEGFGLPVLEAMACGVPVVTSSVSSMPEVGGDAALYADPSDTQQIASALGRVLSDATLRVRMREAGLARAATFTWDTCAQRTLEAFDAAMRR